MAATSVVLVAAGCKGSPEPKTAPPPRAVDVLALAPTPVRDTGEYLGTLISRQSVTLLPQVGGYVRKILVRPGQAVKEGEVVLEIDARQESAALESAQAQQRSAHSGLELAQQTLERTRSLYKEGLVSAQELERAQASLESAQASTSTSAAQVSQRKVQLQYYAVRAPFAGTAGDVLVRVGDFVSGSTPLTSVAQADVLEVTAAIPPERARKVDANTQLELLDSKGAQLLTTSVYFVGPQADPRTQLVDIKGVFKNTLHLRPNEQIRTRVIYGTRDALQVPALAVIRQSGQPFVFVVSTKDGATIVSRKPVTLGPLGERAYVVEKGLSAGDQIATSSLQALRDGAPIAPRVAATGSAATP